MYSRMNFGCYLLSLLLILNTAAFAEDSYPWRLIGPGDADQITSLSILRDGSVWAGTDIGGVYRSRNRGKSWQPMNEGMNNLDISTPVVQAGKRDNVLFMGTRGGLYKSEDKGISWRVSRKGLPVYRASQLTNSIGGLAIDPWNDEVIYLGLGYRPSHEGTSTVKRISWSARVYKSVDGGENWEASEAFDKNSKVYQLLHSRLQPKTVYAATSTGLYRSKDAGANWDKLLSRPTYNLLLSPTDENWIMAAIGGNGLLLSSDGGNEWKSSIQGLSFFFYPNNPYIRYSVLARDPVHREHLYVINSTWGASGGLYRSVDNGGHWKLVTEDMPESWLRTSRRMNAVAIEAGPESGVFLGSSRYLYRSDNQGDNWRQLISRKVGTGWTHTGINVFGQSRTFLADLDDPKIYYAATADHKAVKSVDGGKSWRQIAKSYEESNHVWDFAMCPSGKKTLYMVASSRAGKELCLFQSGDKGENWRKNCDGLGNSTSFERIALDPVDCQRLYYGIKSGVMISSDGGGHWVKAKGLPDAIVLDIFIDPANHQRVLVATREGLFETRDRALSWKKITGKTQGRVSTVSVSRDNPDLIIIGTDHSRNSLAAIFRSTDGGKSWRRVLGGLEKYVSAVTQLPENSKIWYASTNDNNYHDYSKGSGIFRSEDGGVNWKRIDQGLPVYRAYDINVSNLEPKKVFLSTGGSGVYELIDPQYQKLQDKISGM